METESKAFPYTAIGHGDVFRNGECNVAAVDFGGTLILNICENNQDKQIIPDLIELCAEVGIHFETADELPFEQANLRLTI